MNVEEKLQALLTASNTTTGETDTTLTDAVQSLIDGFGGGGGQGFYVMSKTPSSDSSSFYGASVGVGGSDPIFNDILNAIGGMPTHFAFIDESGYVDYVSGKQYMFGGVCGTIIDNGVAIGTQSRVVYKSSSSGFNTNTLSFNLIYNNTYSFTLTSAIDFSMKGGRTYKFFLWR